MSASSARRRAKENKVLAKVAPTNQELPIVSISVIRFFYYERTSNLLNAYAMYDIT